MAGPNGAAPLEPIDALGPPLLIVRRGRQIALPPLARLLLTPAQQAERARLLRGRFYLVNMRLGDVGEVFRCGRCNGKHDRLTRYCLERPFSGLHGALYGFVQTVKDAEAVGRLGPEPSARLDRIRRLFRATHGLPDLGDSHPGLARQLQAGGPERGPVNALDLDVGVVSLGLLERVEPRDAQRLLDRINTRAAAFGEQPLIVPGLRSPDR